MATEVGVSTESGTLEGSGTGGLRGSCNHKPMITTSAVRGTKIAAAIKPTCFQDWPPRTGWSSRCSSDQAPVLTSVGGASCSVSSPPAPSSDHHAGVVLHRLSVEAQKPWHAMFRTSLFQSGVVGHVEAQRPTPSDAVLNVISQLLEPGARDPVSSTAATLASSGASRNLGAHCSEGCERVRVPSFARDLLLHRWLTPSTLRTNPLVPTGMNRDRTGVNLLVSRGFA